MEPDVNNKRLLLIGTNSVNTYSHYELVRDGFQEVRVLFTCNGDYSEKVLGSETYVCSVRHPFQILRFIKAIRRAIREFKPDVIHIHQLTTPCFYSLLAIRRRVPTMIMAWGSDVLVNPKRSFILKKMVQFILRHGDHYTANSQYVASEMRRLAGRELEIPLANLGIELHSQMDEKQNVVFSNRLHNPLYRIDAIIRAFAKFSEHAPDWKLVLAATGSETEKLKALVEELNINDKVEFVGWLDSERNFHYYSIAKIWVSIPESDARPNSLFEAMSMGCIPVVADVPSLHEWIQDGVNGVIVKDIHQEFISKATGIPMEAAAMNRKIVEETATKEANRRKYLQMYERICR